MKYRFRLLEVVDSGAPDYQYCGQVPAVFTSGINLLVKVDGTTVIDETDHKALAPASFVTGSGINVDVAIQDTEYVTININLPEIWDETSLYVYAEGGKLQLPYENTFRIYGYDLGNNPNIINGNGEPVDYNPDMDIVIVPYKRFEGLTAVPNDKPFAKFTKYRRPFTEEVHVYGTASSTGSYTYSDGTDVVATGKNAFLCRDGQLALTQKATIGLLECEETLTVEAAPNLIPDINPTLSCKDVCVNDCLVINTRNTLLTEIAYPTTTFFSNDIEKSPYDENVLSFEVVNYAGVVTQSGSQTVDTSNVPIAYDPQNHLFGSVRFTDIGTNFVNVCLELAEVFKCCKQVQTEACDPAIVKQVTCNTFELTNGSLEVVEVTIAKYNTGTGFDTVLTYTLQGLEVVTTPELDDGVYTFTFVGTGGTTIYTVSVNCLIRDCLLEKVKGILCKDKVCGCQATCKCGSEVELYEFNTTIMLAITYFNLLFEENVLYLTYDALTVEDILRIATLKDVQDKLNLYCEECSTDC